ncbi:hypothetical protein E2C01_038154 [Portunus trituberculatus]|uniref:Uncharacterized protein n=1 Tax=Portunus trituberculatus TaxID=210409 RepID=A0A5B7FBG7_PORTR|nr:hypothetical protein [Portunus trituberculatus]
MIGENVATHRGHRWMAHISGHLRSNGSRKATQVIAKTKDGHQPDASVPRGVTLQSQRGFETHEGDEQGVRFPLNLLVVKFVKSLSEFPFVCRHHSSSGRPERCPREPTDGLYSANLHHGASNGAGDEMQLITCFSPRVGPQAGPHVQQLGKTSVCVTICLMTLV